MDFKRVPLFVSLAHSLENSKSRKEKVSTWEKHAKFTFLYIYNLYYLFVRTYHVFSLLLLLLRLFDCSICKIVCAAIHKIICIVYRYVFSQWKEQNLLIFNEKANALVNTHGEKGPHITNRRENQKKIEQIDKRNKKIISESKASTTKIFLLCTECMFWWSYL